MNQNTKQSIADNAVRIAIDHGGWKSVRILIEQKGAAVCQADIDYARQKFPDDKNLIAILAKSDMGNALAPVNNHLGIII